MINAYFILNLGYVRVKLLHSRKLRILKLDKWNKFGLFGLSERNYTRNSLIIHIHGGGFVSMSSNSHENYLMK